MAELIWTDSRIEMPDFEGAYLSFVEFSEKKVFTITYVFVPNEYRGKGLPTILIQAAIDRAISKGWKVEATCSYAKHRIMTNSDWKKCLNLP